jgi:hypothetical protein
MSQQLIKTRLGRVILHAVCLLRRPTRAHWHWRGIMRELISIRIARTVRIQRPDRGF